MASILKSGPSFTLLGGQPERVAKQVLDRALFRFRIASRSHLIGWGKISKGNFLRRLAYFNRRISFVVLKIRGNNVEIGNGELIRISDLLKSLENSHALFVLLFYGDSSDFSEVKSWPINVLYSCVSSEDSLLTYSLVVECALLSWGSLSLICNPVSIFKFMQIVKRLLQLSSEAQCIAIEELCSGHATDIVWTTKKICSRTIDYDKYISNSRDEQRLDTIKRMLDVEATPISSASSYLQRCARAQALFWLLEVADDSEPGWFCLTESYRLVASKPESIVEQAINNLSIRVSDRPSIEDFVSAFVKVPSGEYTLGDAIRRELSEPPACVRNVKVSDYSILNRPVCYRDWMIFCEPLSSWVLEVLDPEIPVTNVNLLESLVFAQLVENVLKTAGLINNEDCISVPTEEQWEIGARGAMGFQYPWGNEYDSSRCNAEQRVGYPTKIFSFSPAGDSSFGCSDMAGNVREWTCSAVPPIGGWGINVQSCVKTIESVSAYDRIVIKGGSYSYDKECVRAWVRNTQIAARRDKQTGLRLVRCRKMS